MTQQDINNNNRSILEGTSEDSLLHLNPQYDYLKLIPDENSLNSRSVSPNSFHKFLININDESENAVGGAGSVH